MGFRYRKTKSVAPGVKVNLNKKVQACVLAEEVQALH